MSNITVSIFMLTYNQEQFIAQTIESVVMQKTNFNFQLVIGEDNSTDATFSICKKYAEQYPDKIKLLPSLQINIGLIKNYIRTIKECDGKYMAICDGDDYWTDENKLQKQVDFLETHSDYSLVYTSYNNLYPDGSIKQAVHSFSLPESDFSDLIQNNYIASVTVLFRNNIDLNTLPSWIEKLPYGDWPTYLWLLKDGGKIHFSDEVTANYRMDIGVSYSIIKVNSALINVNLGILNCMLNDPDFENRKVEIQKVISDKKNGLMTSFNREKKYLKALKHLIYNLIKNESKVSIIKMYFYSVYKSFA